MFHRIRAGAEQSDTCTVCLGLPGALPALNREAVKMAGKAALALNLKINNESIFARKNYFYPDLPKDNQTFAFERPQAESGASAHAEMFGLRGSEIASHRPSISDPQSSTHATQQSSFDRRVA